MLRQQFCIETIFGSGEGRRRPHFEPFPLIEGGETKLKSPHVVATASELLHTYRL